MLGVVILNYNNYLDTENCANQLLTQISDEDIIYIVDNKSPNESFVYLAEKFADNRQIKVIESGKNAGYSYGNNIGFRQAIYDGCRLILCTNNDVLFKENCVATLKSELLKHGEVAVIGPKIQTDKGTLQKSNKTKLTAFRFFMHHKPFCFFDLFGVNKRYSMLNYNFDHKIIFSGMVSGCCFMIKANVLEEIGFLDEGVFLYHEEDILAHKLMKRNLKTMIEPEAEIVHFGSGSIGEISAFTRYCTFTSGLYYLWNYEKISRFTLHLLSWWINLMFWWKGRKQKEYKEFGIKFKNYVKELAKIKKK